MVELLVASVAALTILTAVFALLQSSHLVQARDSEWALVLQEDRAGIARMMRDIRQATEIVEPASGSAASSYIVFKARIGGKPWKVKYECNSTQSGTSFTECVRLAAEGENPALPATGPRLVRDVTNGTSVFAYSPVTRTEAKFVTAKVEIPSKGTLNQANATGYGGKGHKIVIEDAAFMRNLYPEG
jgi:hypothetical protein